MKGSLFGFSDLVLFAAAIGLGVAGFFWMQRPTEILLLDRPRDGRQSPDFVEEFLKATHTPFELQQGFVTLEASAPVQQRLLQLLGALAYCREAVVAQQAEAKWNSTAAEHPLAFRVTRSGGVEVTTAAARENEAANARRVGGSPAITGSVQDFQRQYTTVLKAIQVTSPGAVSDFATISGEVTDDAATGRVVANSPTAPSAIPDSSRSKVRDGQPARGTEQTRATSFRSNARAEGMANHGITAEPIGSNGSGDGVMDVRELEEIKLPESPQRPWSSPLGN